MTRVRPHEQFVVHSIFVTSSNTVGARISRPPPASTHATSAGARASAARTGARSWSSRSTVRTTSEAALCAFAPRADTEATRPRRPAARTVMLTTSAAAWYAKRNVPASRS